VTAARVPAGTQRPSGGTGVSVEAVVSSVPRELYLNGDWQRAEQRMPVYDPATGSVVTDVADASPADALAAVAAADAALVGWRSTPPRRRAEVLHTVADLLVQHRDELATVITLEMGKPLAEARAEVGYAAGFFRWYAEEAVRIGGRTTSHEDGGARVLTFRRPIGVCVLITPWNFPLAMGARKIAPALAAGCTAIVKPAPQTPLSMLALGQIMQRADLPAGVVNIVTTADAPGVVEPLLDDPRVRKLSFTGSTAAGRHLLARAATQVLRSSMELGGNAPFLVFEDADVPAAVEGALVAKLRNGGQACTSANRIIVHERVVDDFAGMLAARMAGLRVGGGFDPAVDVGPLIDERQLASVIELVDDAVSDCARVLTGGGPLDRPGWFFAPTVLVGVDPGARLLHTEIFGPVAPIIACHDEDEMLALANDTEYGLVGYVFTRDLERALRVVDGLDVGMVGVNRGLVTYVGAPFGGVKQSGFGREGGPEGLEEYLETQYVAM
jgi:succinate-semialdehyde dehydrogenase/glutarate-semialdehyde dehydrogenase